MANTVNDHDDSLIINDIELTIAPTAIKITKESINNQWQTLRTNTSQKTKSGHSTITVEFVLPFVGFKEIHTKLKPLIAQLRYMPFCFVENQFIRENIFPDDLTSPDSATTTDYQTMVFAIRAISINARNDTPGTIWATFQFAYFNYLPYVPYWQYKKDLFGPDASKTVTFPMDSNAWKEFVAPVVNKSTVADSAVGEGSISFLELRTAPVNSVQSFQQTKEILGSISKDQKAFFDNFRKSNAATPDDAILDAVKDTYPQFKNVDEIAAVDLLGPLLINAGPSSNPLSNRYRADGQYLDQAELKKTLAALDQRLSARQDLESGLAASKQSGFELIDGLTFQDNRGEGYGVYRRIREFALNADNGIIIEGISITIQNILATIPIAGHRYATFQHIGSIDASICIDAKITNDNAMSNLAWAYDAINDNMLNNRHIPQGLQTVRIDNEVLALFNLEEFITEDMETSTIEGMPGTYQVKLSFIESGLKQEDRLDVPPNDKFNIEFASSDQRVAKEIAAILNNNISDPNPVKTRPIVSNVNATRSARLAAIVGKYIGSTNELEAELRAKGALPGAQRAPSPLESKLQAAGALPKNSRQTVTTANTSILENSPVTSVSSISSLNTFIEGVADLIFTPGTATPNTLGFTPDANAVNNFISQSTVGNANNFEVLMGMTEDDCPGISKVQEVIQARAKQQKNLDKDISSLANKPLSDLLSQERDRVARATQLDTLRKQQALYQKINFDSSDLSFFDSVTGASDAPPSTLQGEVFNTLINRSTQTLLNTKAFINWLEFLNSFTTAIIESDDIDLPEFADAKKLIGDLRLGRGLPAYPDFQLEDILPDDQKSDPDAILSLDPDCFLATPMNASTKNFIDPALIANAKRTAMTSVDTAVTQIQKYYNDSWLPYSLSQPIADKVKANVKITINEQGSDKSATPAGTVDMYYGKSIAIGKYSNAGFVNTIQLGTLNIDGDQTHSSQSTPVTMQIDSSITHSLNPADLFGDATAAQSKDPVSANLPISNSPTNRGQKLTQSTHSPDGTVDQAPQDLAHAAGANLEEYALARMIASEDSSADQVTKTAIALAAVNHKNLERNGESLDQILTSSPYKNAKGKFGTQVGRYAATSIDPHEDDLRIAKLALYGKVEDFTGGATQWAHPKAQDSQQYAQAIAAIGAARNVNIKKVISFDDLVRSRAASGRIVVDVPGTNPSHIVFFKNTKLKNQFAYTPPTPSVPSPDTGTAAGANVADLSIQAYETSLKNGQGLRLVRAFPTFKLYFIQDNSGNRRRYGLDDFYSYNSVAEITCIRSRKIPADLLEITLTNVSGVLSNRKFQGPRLVDNDSGTDQSDAFINANGAPLEKDPNGFFKNSSDNKNKLASMMLQSGTDVELRLGNANDPDKLTTVFNGKIMEVEFSDSDDLVRVICQSHAVELVQDMKGLTEPKVKDGFFISDARTDIMLEQLMAEPEILHFGRWIRSSAFNSDTNTNRLLLTNKFSLSPSPQDDNIFVPPIEKLKQLDPGFLFSQLKYAMFQTTIWDVFQEMTLRHPGYIASPVPYKDKTGPRMTMYFGLPAQLYFAADPSVEEKNAGSKLKQQIKDYNAPLDELKKSTGVINPNMFNVVNTSANQHSVFGTNAHLELKPDTFLTDRDYAAERLALAKDFQTIRPFRSYHLVTSKQHIISNNIRASAKGTHNTISIQYGKSSFNKDIKQLVQEGTDVLTLKIDAALPDEEVRELFVQYSNCQSELLAKNYATGLLMKELKDVYRGELTIMGNPDIKPYDIVYIFDDYSDIMGPVEVEQVIHRFSQDTGFITEITPDLYVTANEWVNMTVTDMMSIIMEGTASALTHGLPTTTESVLSSDVTKTAALGVFALALGASPLIAVIGAGAAIGGYFMMQKMVDFSTHGQPVVIHPLIHRGKPWVAGLPLNKLNNLWSTNKGQWFKEAFEGLGLWLDDFNDKLVFAASQGDAFNIFSGNSLPAKF